MKRITIKSFAGIGDLLFATPSFRVIKEAYPNSFLIVNSGRGSLLEGNPFIDARGITNEGPHLKYPAPAEGIYPTKHHILSDWEIVCNEYNLKTQPPRLKPELYLAPLHPKREVIGVQTIHKGLWHHKKVWPGFEGLARREGFEAIPLIDSGDKMQGLVRRVSEYKCVVCAEGGISHIAMALGIPAVVLFGGFASPKWSGYSFHINLVSNIDCRYCYNDKPCVGDYQCWEQFSIDDIERIALERKGKI